MHTSRESSLLFSLRELRDIEDERIADERRAEEQRLARLAREAEAAERAAREREAAEARRLAELRLRIAAEAASRIGAEATARAVAESKTRVEAETAARLAAERELAELRQARVSIGTAIDPTVAIRPRRAALPWILAFASVTLAAGAFVYTLTRPARVVTVTDSAPDSVATPPTAEPSLPAPPPDQPTAAVVPADPPAPVVPPRKPRGRRDVRDTAVQNTTNSPVYTCADPTDVLCGATPSAGK